MKQLYLSEDRNMCYYFDKPIKIIKIYELFQLAKVKCEQTQLEFFVDTSCIYLYPQKDEKSISIAILGGVER